MQRMRRGNPRRGSPRDLEIYEEQARGEATGGIVATTSVGAGAGKGRGGAPAAAVGPAPLLVPQDLPEGGEGLPGGRRCVHHGPVSSLLPRNLQRGVGGRGETAALVLLAGAAGGEGEVAEGGAREAGVSAGRFRMTAGEENGRSSGWARGWLSLQEWGLEGGFGCQPKFGGHARALFFLPELPYLVIGLK